jgi:hypothetical protein
METIERGFGNVVGRCNFVICIIKCTGKNGFILHLKKKKNKIIATPISLSTIL